MVIGLDEKFVCSFEGACEKYGGIAQLARAHGSYPWCREFKSPFRYLLSYH